MNVSTPVSPAAAFAAFQLGTGISQFRTQFHFQVFISEAEFALFSARDTNSLKERLSGILSEYNNLISQVPEWAAIAKLADFHALHKSSMIMLDQFFGTETSGPSTAWIKIMEDCSVLEDHRSDVDDATIRKDVQRITELVEAEIPYLVTKMEQVLSTLEHGAKSFFDLGTMFAKVRRAQITGDESEETVDSQSDACSTNESEKPLSKLTSLVKKCNGYQPQAKLAEYSPIASGNRSADLNAWQSSILMRLENSFLRACLNAPGLPIQMPAQPDGSKYYTFKGVATPPDHDHLVTIYQLVAILKDCFESEGGVSRLHEWKKEGWGQPDGTASGADAWLWGRIKPIVLGQVNSKRRGRKPKNTAQSNPIGTQGDPVEPEHGLPEHN